MKKCLLAIAAILLFQVNADARKVYKHHHKRHASHKPTYYYNSGHASGKDKHIGSADDKNRPSAYKGDKVPENDGMKKNKQRNLNYNSGQTLPGGNVR